MTLSSKLAGITLGIFMVSLPFLSEDGAKSNHEAALEHFYHSVVVVPQTLLRQGPAVEPKFCLLGAPDCGELHPRPVEPCLVGVERCSGDVRVYLLSKQPGHVDGE